MQSNPYRTYVEDGILTADPVKLVQLLYRGAIEAVAAARAKLASGEIKSRSAAVSKAIEILAELASTLDHEKGGELSVRLAALYDYMQRRLIDGNSGQADAPLAEVGRILQTLEEAWLQVKAPVTENSFGPRKLPNENEGIVLNQPAPAEYVPLSCAC